MTSEEVLEQELNLIKVELVQRHNELGMRASGKWASSLSENVEAIKSRIIGSVEGENYTSQLIYGRKPGKFPPIKSIEEWIVAKPIAIADNISISTLAFLIARKIAKEGTKYYKQGGTNLIEEIITPKRIQRIINRVYQLNVDKTVTTITNYIKQIAI